VIVRGDGVAAYCCAYLLEKAGFRIDLQPVNRPRLPVILLGEPAVALLRDVFDQPSLFADLPRIRKRIVAWGLQAKPVEVEHSAVVISEDALLDAVRPSFPPETKQDTAQEASWTIYAARPLPHAVAEHRFGSRTAFATRVTLKETSDPACCWIESLDEGWLFLLAGWLLSVGASREALLGQSRLIAPEIADCGPARGTFPAYARIVSPLAASLPAGGWLACGTAAMSFDPICGDGMAHSIREAILASAVIRALANGGSAASLLAHYEARLTAGFERHLTLCRQFYQTGGAGSLWRSEADAIDRGIEWCQGALANHRDFQYQLRGFELFKRNAVR
jgi:hypothetical protein